MRNTKGSTLIIVLLIAFTSLSIALGMMQLSTTKTIKAVNNKNSLQAFYAAEAGINEAIDVLVDNQDIIYQEPTEDSLNLPTSDNSSTLGDSQYYVELAYSGDSIVIESTGISGTSKKKIRTKVNLEYDSAFNFGFLSKDAVTIYTGQIEYGMDIHGNNGLDGKGNDKNYTHLGSAIGTQSVDKTPSGATSYWGQYRPAVEVPEVDFDYFNEQMFGSIEPTYNETDLTIINGIKDTDNNIMFTSTYLQNNSHIEIPSPNAVVSNNETETPLISYKIDTTKIESIANNLITSLASSSFINQSVTYSLSLGNRLSDLIIGGNGNGNNGNGNGNQSDDEVIDDGTDDTAIDDGITYEDEVTEDTTEEETTEDDTTIDEDVVYEDETEDSSPGNSGNSNGNSSNSNGNSSNSASDESSSNGQNSGGYGDLTINIPAGDYNGKILYFDNANVGSLNINFLGIAENITIVATGSVVFCGADLVGEESGSGGGDNRGVKNFALATGGDITHNGRIYVDGGLYWLNGSFRQNGRSDFFNSRIIAQGTIDTHGHFSLTTDGNLTEYDFVPKKIAVQTWQEIAAE
ncbi:MAG: pilus assembly PilX N-terminal domain-containing protein [Vampirovibrionia bacterium]